jgi:hypothetical protein
VEAMSSYILKLYVRTETSAKTKKNLFSALMTGPKGWVLKEIVDVTAHPEKAAEAEVMVTPCLDIEHEGKSFRLVGDFSTDEEIERLLAIFEEQQCDGTS